MLRRGTISLLVALTVLPLAGLFLGEAPARADSRCHWQGEGDSKQLICIVTTPATTTSTASKPPGGGSEGGGEPVNENLEECAWRAVQPQPAAGDPRWNGNDPATGVVQTNGCNGTNQYRFALSQVAPLPDPAVLAQEAFTLLQLPDPTLGRSPSLENGDPAKGGQAYTIVNLWTWFYTDPATFVPMSKTVSLQGVSATVTAIPTALLFSPGDGHPAVSCAGPGRPWESLDQFDAPDAGGCGYQYTEVQAEPITGTVSISWDVSWTGTGGAGGVFDGVATSSSSQFIVEQIQTVVR